MGKEEVSISYSTDHETLVSKMIQGEVKLGLLPEPYVTTALMKNKNLRVAVDINKEWMKKNHIPLEIYRKHWKAWVILARVMQLQLL